MSTVTRALGVARLLLIGVAAILGGATGAYAQADNCATVGGTIVDGVCVVSAPSPTVSGSLNFNETLLIDTNGRINVAPAGVTITIAGDFRMALNSLLTAGENLTCGGGSINGGNITIAATGSVHTSAGSTIRSNGCSGGAISIASTGGGEITLGGLVESAGARTGTGAVQGLGGGSINIDAGCVLTIESEARITSRGKDPGANLVHLEGCEVIVRGRVESTGNGHAPPDNPVNSCVLPGKSPSSTACIQIWAGRTVLIDSTGANKGELNADIGFAGGSNGRSWIEIIAGGAVTITDGPGNDHSVQIPGGPLIPITSAVHANMIGMTNGNGGLITIQSATADVVANGEAAEASARNSAGGKGGQIHIEAAQMLTLDGASIFAKGDTNGQGGFGNGGQIGTASAPIRAFAGALSWASGTGDAQPTGAPLNGGATGAINLQGCGTVTATASFPVTQGAFSPTISTVCGTGPTLPGYVVLPSNCSETCDARPPGSIAGAKWLDQNGNGVREALEPPVPTWRIHLFAAGSQTELAQTFTHVDGTYSFPNLADGMYEICESQNPNWTQTFPTAAGFNCQARTGGFGYGITIVGGQILSGNDFGNQYTAPTVGLKQGVKWNDLNANNFRDAGEPGIAGTQIHLFKPFDPAFHLQVETDATGNYGFTALAPGLYTVCETVPAGFIQTSPDFLVRAAPLGEQVVDCSGFPGVSGAGYRFLISEGSEIASENDFGNQLIPPTGEIAGVKFDDVNGNGVRDPGEPGLPGWQINVYLPGSTAALATLTTDVDGTYVFENLPAGTYDVCETMMPGWAQTFPGSARTFAGLDCAARTGGTGYSVTLAAGQLEFGVDFGNHFPAADIRVQKQVDNPMPNVGDTVTFTVTVTNLGPDPATGVVITDQVPTGLMILAATPSVGTIDAATGRWLIGAMPVGFSATLVLSARVLTPGTQTNLAIKTGGDQVDPDPSNNSSSATISSSVIAEVIADVGVLKIVPVRGVRATEGVTFRIIVLNHGPSPATGVVVVDRLPDGLTFLSADPGVGTYDPVTGEWTIGDLAVNAPVVLTLRAILEVPGPILNIATKTEQNEIDPNPTNNTDGEVVNGTFADLQVVKTVDRPLVSPGEVVTFTIVVTNNGLAAATGVRVRDVLPAGLVFLSATATQGIYVPETGFWDVGSLAPAGPASHATLTIAATATVTGEPINTAVIFASDQPDPNPANNISTIGAEVTAGPDLTADLDEIIGNPEEVGAIADFFIAARNQSESTFSGRVTIAFTIPEELEFMQMAADGWDCTFLGLTAFCSTDRVIPPGQSVVAGFWTTVIRLPRPGSVAFASVTADADTDILDNFITVPLTQVAGPPSNLAVTQTVTGTGLGLATYDVVVTNQGPSDAVDVVLTDALAQAATLESAVPQAGTCTGTRYVACQLGTLPVGVSRHVTVVLRGAPAGLLVHTVAAGSAFDDPDVTNNMSTLSFAFGAPATRDTDADGMPDVWESAMGLDVATPDAEGDPDGDGVSNRQEFADGTHPRGFYRRYFAEGVSSSFFETYIAAMDMSDHGAAVSFSLLGENGERTTATRAIGPHDSIAIDAAQLLGAQSRSFATVVESDRPLAADRLVTWAQQDSAHAERGLDAPSRVWYFAEGATTAAFDLFYLLQNSEPVPADVTVTYMPESSPSFTRSYRIEPRSRLTIWANFVEGLPPDSLGAVVRASHPIIAERAMYLRPSWSGGHGGAGATTTSPTWYFAEGATGRFFDCFILVVNPNATPADIEARFARPDGQVVTRTYTVLPERRLSIWVDTVDPAIANADVSVTLTSLNGVEFVAERAMWWPESGWYEGHVSVASLETSPRWVIPDALEGGPHLSQTYVLVSNAAAVAGQVAVTVRFPGGEERMQRLDLLPAARMTIPIGEMFPETLGRHYSVTVESLGTARVPLIVECARYWSTLGQLWSAGVSALATPMP
jgi:uncharacterized repeat protein (TIGR01451 family)